MTLLRIDEIEIQKGVKESRTVKYSETFDLKKCIKIFWTSFKNDQKKSPQKIHIPTSMCQTKLNRHK